MNTRTDKAKLEFAKRLHLGMDSAGYPLRGRARILSREFDISDKGAGKWLNGEAIPEMSKISHLADFLNVNAEWLLTGKELSTIAIRNLPKKNYDQLTTENQDIVDLVNSLQQIDEKKQLTPELIKAIKAILDLALSNRK